MFCKHDYDILDKIIIESQMERLVKLGLSKGNSNFISSDGKQIIIYKCKKCGKIKETIIKI